jgi:peptidoglycan/LPS O-acetylase OafA/YrhL
MAQQTQVLSRELEADPENPGGFTHIPALDGIRGLAILLVLFHHLFWANGRTGVWIFDTLSSIRESSYIGVNLFFALSGFLITGILMDTVHISHYFSSFYARRSLRIFPLYYGFLLLLLCLTRPMHFVWNGMQYFALTYTGNWMLLLHPIFFNLGLVSLNHFWSLQVEEQFYWVWPLIIYRFRRGMSVLRVSAVGCLVVLGIRIFLVAVRLHPFFQNSIFGNPVFRSPYLTYSTTFACADQILFGCCLAALVRTSYRARLMQLAPRVLLASSILLLALGIANSGLSFTDPSNRITGFILPTFGFSLIGIVCASTVACALKQASFAQRFFQIPALRFFGKYSYGIYVFHLPLNGFLGAPLRAFLDAHLRSKALGVLFEASTVAMISVLLAYISYHCYEVHFLRLKRFFRYNRAAN